MYVYAWMGAGNMESETVFLICCSLYLVNMFYACVVYCFPNLLLARVLAQSEIDNATIPVVEGV